MRVFSYLTPKAKVRSSSIHKKGIFAKKLIKKGEIISVSGGYIIEKREYKNLLKKDSKFFRAYVTKVADGFYLGCFKKKDLEDEDFFNHSCNPNAGFKGQIVMVAMRDIKPGEEITYDYAMTDSDRRDYFKCHCGAKNCRKVITGKDWKKSTLQRKYQGYFSWHIQEKIKKLKRKLKKS